MIVLVIFAETEVSKSHANPLLIEALLLARKANPGGSALFTPR